MRFLVDQPLSPSVAAWLREQGHDALHVRERAMSRATDEEIFAFATQEARIIVTADLDFARVLALSGRDAPGLVLFRAGSISDDEMLALMRMTIERVPATQLEHSAVVVDQTAIRIAALPLRPDLAGGAG